MRFSVCVNTIVFSLLSGFQLADAQPAPPRVFLVDAATLAAQKAHPDHELLELAKAEADAAMKQKPLTITDKAKIPPSGDKHDYVSMARYFWPNPATKDHLPYIRKDGQTNPEIHDLPDHEYLDHIANSSRALALGWYLTGDERYAEHSALLLRVFFLNPDTAMNPNLEYAQYVPGVNTGRGTGILDARGLAIAVDAVGLLARSRSWTAADDQGMHAWMAKYYTWLRGSAHGHDEEKATNNHGSWYAAQAASLAMFLGKTDDAKAIAERVSTERIPSQFDAAGLQKLELARTNSFSYSAFNLEALTELAQIVSATGVDLYASKPGIIAGLDALMPYDAQHPWPHEQIGKDMEGSVCPALIRVAAHTHEAKYVEDEPRYGCKVNAETWIEAHTR